MCFGMTPGTPSNPTAVPTWMKFSFTHLQLQAAALTNDFEIYSAPARVQLGGAVLKHSAAFGGGAIASYTLSLGLTGDLARYLSPFSAFGAPANTKPTGYAEGYLLDQLQFGAVTSIRVAAVATGANLSASTAGAATLWLLISRLAAP